MSMASKVVFLDRDGVINHYPGNGNYICSVKDFKLIPGSAEGIKKLNENGFEVFIISNQSGVAKGLYSQKVLDGIDHKLKRQLKKAKARVSGIYYCLHNASENCSCRKPRTGLLDRALKEHRLNQGISFFIGDSFVDLQTALAFGAKAVLVLSGREKVSDRLNWEFEPEYVFDNLLVAAHYLCALNLI